MKKGIIILLCLLITSFSMAALTGTGYGKNEKESRRAALEELTSTISVDVNSEFYNIEAVQNDEYFKSTSKETNVSSNIKLIGVKYNTVREKVRQYRTEAYLDSSAIPVYSREIDQLYERINTSYSKSKTMEKESRLQALRSISDLINEFYNYQTILSLLGDSKTKNLVFTKAEVEAEITSISKILNKKKNVFIENFLGHSENGSLGAIEQQFSSWLISSNRFNIVKDKQLADYVVSGKILSFYIDEIEEVRDFKTGDIIEYDAYGTTIQLEIKFYDRENAKFTISKTATGSGYHNGNEFENANRNKSIVDAREDLMYKIIAAVDEEFIISAGILDIARNKIVEINKGSEVGVKKHMDFFIYHPNDKLFKNKIAGLRITSVEDRVSVGQIFEVFNSGVIVKPGFVIREAKEEVKIQGRIFKKKRNKVLLNLGTNMNIAKGDVYYIYDNKNGEIIKDPDTGFILSEKRKQKGKIVIMEINENYAEAKVVRGALDVKENMYAKESNDSNIKLRFEIKRSIQNAKVIQNDEATYSDGKTGYYGNNGTDISEKELDASQWKLGIGFSALSWPVNWEMEIGNINIEDEVKGVELTIGGRYNINLIGRTLVSYIGANVGFGAVNQTDVREITDSSDYEDADIIEQAVDESVSAAAKTGLELNYGGLLIGAEVGYKNLKFDDFKYYDGELALEQDLDQDGLKYREIDMSGVYYQLSIGYEF